MERFGSRVSSKCLVAVMAAACVVPSAIGLVAESGSLTVTSLTLHHLKSIGLD